MKFIVFKFWRLEVQDQGEGRLIPSEVMRETVPGLSPHFWWLLAMFGVPWLIDALPQSLPSSSQDLLPVYLPVSKFPSHT